jgi:hypothetical protein
MNKQKITIPFMLKICFVRLPMAIVSSIILDAFRLFAPLRLLAQEVKLIKPMSLICLSAIDDVILVVRHLEKEETTEEQVNKGRMLAELNKMREDSLAIFKEMSNGES